MNRETLSDWIQIVGMVAIVASLVFVGLQMKQSQEIAIAAQYQARLDAASGHYTALLQSDPALRVIGADILADIQAEQDVPPEVKAWAANQPVEELAFRVVGAVIFLKSHDNVHFQYQSGFLSEEAWSALRVQLKDGLNDPRTWSRAVYEDNPGVWRKSYRELIQELLDENGPATQ
jgi:hypothetical protein